jgi:hypothetical protein
MNKKNELVRFLINNCQNDDSETIKKKEEHFFRRRKFDVLMEFIYLKILSTRNCSAFINEISFFYFFVWD